MRLLTGSWESKLEEVAAAFLAALAGTADAPPAQDKFPCVRPAVPALSMNGVSRVAGPEGTGAERWPWTSTEQVLGEAELRSL